MDLKHNALQSAAARMKRRFGRALAVAPLFFALSAAPGAVCAAPSGESAEIYAQIDGLMTPGPKQKAGELQKKELLITALKREKIDPNSARLAIQSIAEIFDFRLSRSGDRYVYELGAGRKLVLLRYERDKRIYETRADGANRFVARLVDIPAGESAKSPALAAGIPDDDGEIDVERRAMVPDVPDVPAGADGDDALAHRPSPDIAFPDSPPSADASDAAQDAPDSDNHASGGGFAQNRDDADPIGGDRREFPQIQADSEAEDDALSALNKAKMQLPLDDGGFGDDGGARRPGAGGQKQKAGIPGEKNTRRDSADGIQSIQLKCKSDDKAEHAIAAVAFILGLLMFAAGFAAVLLPYCRARRRAARMGLTIADQRPISRNQTLLRVKWEDREFVIVLLPEKVQCIVPSENAADLFAFIRAKSYWNAMGDQPIADRRLTALLADFKNKKNRSGDAKTAPIIDPAQRADDAPAIHATAHGFDSVQSDDADGVHDDQDETVQGLESDLLGEDDDPRDGIDNSDIIISSSGEDNSDNCDKNCIK